MDVIFDSVGGKIFKKSLNLLGSGGRIVLLGIAQMAGQRRNVFRSLRALIEFGVCIPMLLLMRSQSLIGVNMLRIADHHPDILKRCMTKVMDLAQRGELDPKIGGVFPVEQISEAHELLGMRKSVGKLILKWTN